MIEQNELIGLFYCGLVAPTSFLIFVKIVLFVDARESEKKKKKMLCWVLLFVTNNNELNKMDNSLIGIVSLWLRCTLIIVALCLIWLFT